ncbi:MAG: P-loop NTPase, partial [Gammaproteobacteria bacterium]|nr:P-loop NTPase [Gammaproteobacteria bacterium]
TPQNIALADARKGIEMFRKVNVPILGVIENMSYFRCDECGKIHDIFASDGGKSVSVEYGTRLLGAFPLDPLIRKQTDEGHPPVVSHPESDVSKEYVIAARKAAASLWLNQSQTTPKPTIKMNPA